MASTDPGGGPESPRHRIVVQNDPVYRRRRLVVAIGAVLVLLLVALLAWLWLGRDRGAADEAGTTPSSPVADLTAPAAGGDAADASEEATEADAATEDDGEAADGQKDASGSDDDAGAGKAVWQKDPAPTEHRSDATALEQVDYFVEGTPKSVVSSGHGLVITNNMMYSNNSSIIDAESREVLDRIDDSVDLGAFGIEGHPGLSVGAPVEATWTTDGRYAYVSQYSMSGPNFPREGFDDCVKDSGVDPSMVYRFDAEEMTWDQVIQVGAVPKYLELSPDQKTLLVSNWCDYTVSVVDTATGQETGTLDVGRNPRGIVVMPDNKTAIVTAMWNQQVWRLDLEEMTSEVVLETPPGPRHLNLSPDAETLYLVVARADVIYKLDPETMEIVDEVNPGQEPRSMTMSPDGSALYVVNYDEASVSKIRTSDMEVIDKVQVDAFPIGIDYDPVTNSVWVACYGGGIYVFDDQTTLLEPSA
ncbi:YncE family protein [Ornithinimicrobium panacihumi]|uniref:YncE family protein n=1 Tax=Ornithinimicrobium panacihumi TaxID=2008449 RepID=UPI003F8B6519